MKEELAVTAHLARLELSEEELARLETEVIQMLEYFSRMREIDVSDLPPTAQLVKDNRLREDTVQTKDISDRILDNSPELEERFIVIPNVL